MGTFPKRGGGSPIPKTLSKFTNMVLEYHLKNDFFLKRGGKGFPKGGGAGHRALEEGQFRKKIFAFESFFLDTN